MDYLFDKRGNCLSIMLTLKYSDYKDIIFGAYKEKGGIEGQRDALKTSTAIRIRKRMIADILLGTVLPPVVIGAVIDDESYEELAKRTKDQIIQLLIDHPENVSLIDGMQRTTAMIEAENESNGRLEDYQLRVEVWFARNTNSLIYRMLVLNSGQVPWDLKRQLETVFKSLIKDLKKSIPEITIYQLDDKGRRKAPGQYRAADILDLYLVFGSRKEKVDIKERLADEFVRLDMIEVSSYDESGRLFADALTLMANFDKAFSRYKNINNLGLRSRFSDGDDVFASQTVRVGFITATSINMLGRPGSSHDPERLKTIWNDKRTKISKLIERINDMNNDELEEFLSLNVLSEKLQNKKVPKVGDFEREFFKVAFETMYIEGENIDTFRICWLAN